MNLALINLVLFLFVKNRRAPRRRARRRAERAVNNFLEIQALRQLVQSESESSGNIETEDEARGTASEDTENNDDDDGLGAMDNNLNNEEHNDRSSESGASEREADSGESNASEGVADSGDSNDSEGEPVEPVEMTEEGKEDFLIQALREWASSGGVLSMRKVDELLGKLAFAFQRIPLSYKTLLSSSRNHGIKIREDFKFWYKGIIKNLNQFNLETYLNVYGAITIDVNMDGLPLYKDSSDHSSRKF